MTEERDHTSEVELNRILRRVDWRFLLPDPTPGRTVCFADDLLPGLRRVADTIVPQGDAQQCDLAAAVDPDASLMRNAFDSLRPGGVYYTEWYSTRAIRTRGVRERLSAAGFRVAGLYWAWPAPRSGAASFWLPLHYPATIDYFLRHRPSQGGILSHLRRRSIATAWNTARLSGITWPVVAVAERPGGASAPTESGSSTILLTGGGHSTNKVVSLVFHEGETAPYLAAKMSRSPRSRPALLREAAALQSVSRLHPQGMPGVPEVLFVRDEDRLTTVGESALTGTPIYTHLRPETYPALAFQATKWLAQLSGQPASSPPAQWMDRLVTPVVRRFERLYGSVTQPEMLRKSARLVAGLGPLPLVPEQRDFSPWNVQMSPRGDLVVLDWESAEPHGLPAADLIYFLAHSTFFLSGAMDSGQVTGPYRDAFLPSTRFGRVARDCLALYTASVRMDAGSLHPIALWTWMLHACSEYERMSAGSSNHPDSAQVMGGIFFRLWQEELRRPIQPFSSPAETVTGV